MNIYFAWIKMGKEGCGLRLELNLLFCADCYEMIINQKSVGSQFTTMIHAQPL